MLIDNGAPTPSIDAQPTADEQPEKSVDFQSGSLSSVPRIMHTYGRTIKNAEQVKEFVEAPLVRTCVTLYVKNIQTLGSGANLESTHPAFIYINWETLSEENRKIALSLGLSPEPQVNQQESSPLMLNIRMDINESTTTKQIADHFEEIADQFVEQEPSWIKSFSWDDMRKIYGLGEDDIIAAEDFEDFAYDPDTERFYSSEDHLQKVRKWQQEEVDRQVKLIA